MNTYDIALMQHSKYIDTLFTYKSAYDYNIGEIVLIPFGISNKQMQGIIIYKNNSPINEKTKNIISKMDNSYFLSEKQIEIAIFIRNHYMSSYYEALRLFTSPSKYTKLSENYSINIILTDREKLQKLIKNTRKNAKNKINFYQTLDKYQRISKNQIEEILDIKINTYLHKLIEDKIIKIEKVSTFKLNNFEKEEKQSLKLNQEQEYALENIKNIYKNFENKIILLHGITGSGKTKLYIEAVKNILNSGKSVIILVPEISLTTQTISRFVSEFDEEIAILHSKLTKREKFDQWLKIKNKIAKIVIGARSALFAPIDDIGAIIIDECHDEAYKSEQSPKYDTVEVAEKMSKLYNCLVILASATPSISQYHSSVIDKKYHLLKLSKRANNKNLPDIVVVNMIDELKNGNKLDISKTLQIQIQKALADDLSVILFLNKRGYSNQLTCNNCAYVPKCENCDISLTYHKTTNSYKCHYCNYEVQSFDNCPNCRQGKLLMLGTGTQKIQSEVSILFPNANIFRLDKDISNDKNMDEKIINDFKNSKKSILIGTQMIGKGHDFPNVSLVGIINADQGLNSPDYKATERTYNLIEQVSGRAGRGAQNGIVVVQTFSQNNPLLYYLKTHNYEEFYKDEIEKRKIFSYEPYGNIIRLTITSPLEKHAFSSAIKIKDALDFYNKNKFQSKIKIFEPSACLITKIDKKYRYQIIIKIDNTLLDKVKKMINYTLTNKRKIVLDNDTVSVLVDINSGNML